MAWLRIAAYHDRIFPLANGLPLLLCLWNRDLRLLYGMSAALTAISVYKVFGLLLENLETVYLYVTLFSQLVNIWLVALVIHRLLNSQKKLEKANLQLDQINRELEFSNEELAASNEELAASNEELTAREEEISSQTEELEQQAEELRQQSEETEQQSSELHDLNQELLRKGRGLQILLESGRWLRGEMSESLVMYGICQAAVQIFSDGVHAAAITQNQEGVLVSKGDYGLTLRGISKNGISFERSFTSLLLESRRTACVEDLSIRPDLQLPMPSAGPPFQSILGSPIWIDGTVHSTIEVYSSTPRHWSENEFRIIEWLAAQAAVAFQAIRAQKELEQNSRAAEDASIQKSRFLAAVSHDVRTPANAIALLAEFIRKCASDPEKYQQIPDLAENLWANAHAMVELISDVLDITRLDFGHKELDASDFSLCELLESEVRQAQPHAESKGLKILCKLPTTNIRLRSDRVKLSRVLSNLISNAVKFTQAGEVHVECISGNAGGIQVQVIDTGIGIPSEQLESVFDEFFQLRNPERNREKGAGLGLAICKRLVKRLGFDISVKSLLGVGSTFSIQIPAKHLLHAYPADTDAPIPATPKQADESKRISLDGMSILLVEDHEIVREITAELLTSEGARVCKAINGRDAVRLLLSGNHELLLLDLNLPDFDGVDVLKRLQSNRPASLRWVLVVSADVRPERANEIIQLGAHAMIPKPISIQKIFEALNEHPGYPQAYPLQP
jgi:signal transduction histidine kinase/ActR/RegA family two-component response regulator